MYSLLNDLQKVNDFLVDSVHIKVNISTCIYYLNKYCYQWKPNSDNKDFANIITTLMITANIHYCLVKCSLILYTLEIKVE